MQDVQNRQDLRGIAIQKVGIKEAHLPFLIKTREGGYQQVLARIRELCDPDTITVSDHLSLIATVVRGMVRNFGTAARLFTAISAQGISIRTIDQGSSELNIIVGVDEDDFETAVKAIYDTFVRM